MLLVLDRTIGPFFSVLNKIVGLPLLNPNTGD